MNSFTVVALSSARYVVVGLLGFFLLSGCAASIGRRELSERVIEPETSTWPWPKHFFAVGFEYNDAVNDELDELINPGRGLTLALCPGLNSDDVRFALDLGGTFLRRRVDAMLVGDDYLNTFNLRAGLRMAPTYWELLRPYLRGGVQYRADHFKDPNTPASEVEDEYKAEEGIGFYAAGGIELRFAKDAMIQSEVRYERVDNLYELGGRSVDAENLALSVSLAFLFGG